MATKAEAKEEAIAHYVSLYTVWDLGQTFKSRCQPRNLKPRDFISIV